MMRFRHSACLLFGAIVSNKQNRTCRVSCDFNRSALAQDPSGPNQGVHSFKLSPGAAGDMKPHGTGERVKKIGNVARVRNATQRRALEQAKRVPWPRLAKAAHEYTDWHVFALWARAMVETANNVPPTVQSEIERRDPGAFSALHSKVEATINRGAHPGVVAWEEVIGWAEMNVFLAAKRGGWLDALRYSSAMSLRSMKAWSHWERVNADWRVSPPGKLPTLREWEGMVASVSRLSNAECAAQRTLDAMRTMRESDWDKLLAAFAHLNAFGQW